MKLEGAGDYCERVPQAESRITPSHGPTSVFVIVTAESDRIRPLSSSSTCQNYLQTVSVSLPPARPVSFRTAFLANTAGPQFCSRTCADLECGGSTTLNPSYGEVWCGLPGGWLRALPFVTWRSLHYCCETHRFLHVSGQRWARAKPPRSRPLGAVYKIVTPELESEFWVQNPMLCVVCGRCFFRDMSKERLLNGDGACRDEENTEQHSATCGSCERFIFQLPRIVAPSLS